ncbi:hypothetical protein TcCL_ESM08126 [Trypanosoma cruzi]|nr:hypothetical protein TcCL_ESM08126 [Trypanosoma cruzi]
MLSVCTANDTGKDTEGDCPVHPPPRHALGGVQRRRAKPRAWKPPMRRAGLAAAHAHSPAHILSHNFPTHNRAKKCKGKPHRKNARRSTAIHVAPQERVTRTAHPRPQLEGRGASKSTVLPFTSLRLDGLKLRLTAGCGVTHAQRGAAHTIRSPLRVHSAGQGNAPESPSCLRKGEHKQSSPLAISASSSKKKWGHVNSTASSGTLKGTRRNTVAVNTTQKKPQ